MTAAKILGSQPALFGEDFHPLNAWLGDRFPQVEPGQFYRELFPSGELAEAGDQVRGKYRGVAIRIKDHRPRRFAINDDLGILDQTAQATPDEFWLASPVSYAGRTQRQDMARYLYAVAIDLDGIRIEDPRDPRGLGAMWNQISGELQPRPTYIVSSGTGLHMYYFLERPIAMYRNVIGQLQRFRHELIGWVWSSFVTELWKKPQYESVTQGFRMVGTCTKTGGRVIAFRTGEPVSIDYLNRWVEPKNRVTDVSYKPRLPLTEAKEKYPDWYQNRIIEGRPRGHWTVKRALYEWWRDQKIRQASVGHRYFYLMSLAIYAVKCGISEDELYRDAWALVPVLRKQDKPGNPLLDSDVVKALEMYNANYQTFPRRSIEALTAIDMPANKRNYRPQKTHIKIMRSTRDILYPEGEWRYHGGAPTKEHIVQAWREKHPDGRKIDCQRETGLSRPTVLKWWN